MSKSPKPTGKKGDALIPIQFSSEDSLRELTYLVTSESQLGIYDDFGTIFERRAAEVKGFREVSVQRRVRRKQEKVKAERAMAEEMLRQRNHDVQHLANLKKYGIVIQRTMRGYPIRKKYMVLRESLQERSVKRAVVIGIDRYDDSRLRSTTHNVVNALEMAVALQQLNFQVEVLIDNSSNASRYRPTRANIFRALEEVKQNTTDMVLVYIACHGVYAPVQGHNPYRAISKEIGGAQTPRTRLGIVLQRSINRSKNGGEDVKENVVRALLPCDAKVSRLSFDSVVTLEEIEEIVLNTGGPLIHGRRAAQRVLAIDTSHFGVHEGSQGFGYAFFGASTTREHLWDYPRPSSQNHEKYGILSLGLTKALTLACHRVLGMSIRGITKFVRAVMDQYEIPLTPKGSDWGDIPILSNERAAHFENLIQPSHTFSHFFEPDCHERVDEHTRPVVCKPSMCCARLYVVIDMLHSDRIDFESNDYLHDIATSVQSLCMDQPRWTHAMNSKVQVGCVEPSWQLLIGLNGTFVDVAKTKKGEGSVWDSVMVALLGNVGGRTYSVQTGKIFEGGLLLAITTQDPSDVTKCLGNLNKIADVLGFGYKTYSIKFALAAFMSQVQLETLTLLTRTTAAVKPKVDKIRPGAGGGKDDDVQDLLRAVRSRDETSPSSFSEDLQRSIVFSIVDARLLLPRVTDIPAPLADSLARRDKPLITPSGPMQVGTALFLCAVAGTPEAKARQIVEVAKVMQMYQPFRGIVYMYWEDVPGLSFDSAKEKFVKHLGRLKPHVPFPSLLLIDSAKKRNYLLKLWQDKAFFAANYVTQFSEEFLKGAMTDLLPPVRGSRVYGCGSTNSKFVLIQT